MAIFKDKTSSEKSHDPKVNGEEIPDILKRFLTGLKKSSHTKQLTVGVVSGVATGYVSSKFGKLAAIAIGGSMLILQIAQYNGYIEIDWKKVNQDVKAVKMNMNKNRSHIPVILENVQNFVKENVVLAGGFASGFLIGFAWA